AVAYTGAAPVFTPDGRRLISGHDDGTAIVWDLSGTRRPAADMAALTSEALAKLWEALAGDDAAKAFAAGWELSDHPKQAVAFLRERMKPSRPADEATVTKLIAELGS